MNAATKPESTALTLPERAAVALSSPAHEVQLRELVKASAAIVTVTNKDGRDECHAAYMKLKNTRVEINHTVDDVTEDAKAFTKAVKTEAARLLEITLAEESRLQKLRDAWDDAEQARKDALIAAERERVAKIRTKIDNIKAAPLRHVTSDSAELAKAVEFYLAMPITEFQFEEFTDEVMQAIGTTLEKLREMGVAAAVAEQAARDAEAARQAEIARLEAERAENARIAAENARVAAEIAAERQRLAGEVSAQQAAARAAQEAIEAAARAEREAQARVAAETKRQLEAQQAAIAEDRRKLQEQKDAADARDATAAKAIQEAMDRDAFHGEALAMNAEIDAERATVADVVELADATATDPLESLLDQVDAGDISIDEVPIGDDEIIDLVSEVFGLSRAATVDRLQSIDFAAARGSS